MNKKNGLIRNLLYWFEGKFGKYRKAYRFQVTDSIPEKLEKRTIYIERLDGKDYEMDFICPFNCGEKIQLNMDTVFHPFWKTDFKKNISPSIDVQDSCKCHYFIRDGKIKIAK